MEAAYIDWALGQTRTPLFLARVFAGYALLDAAGMAAFLGLADNLDAPDLVSRLALRQAPDRRRAEATLRRLAVSWAPRARLQPLLARALKPGYRAVSVGHANQTARVYAALRGSGAGQIVTLIHDVIPLDYPEYTRPGAVERFRDQLGVIAKGSDLLIYNSAYTAAQSTHWLTGMGLPRAGVTAHLGLAEGLTPVPRAPTAHPAFLTLGTIEPRKNHLLLLSLWRRVHDTLSTDKIPHLHIIGRRGWENEMVVDVLERAPFMGKTVFEHGFLDDAALAQHLAGARALLFPSLAEGFGLPLVEGLAAGLPVICSDIPPFRELGGTAPTYLDPLDGTGWLSAILDLSTPIMPGTRTRVVPSLPSWSTHFRTVEAAMEHALGHGQTGAGHEA